MSDLPTSLIRLRLGQEDAHYGGNLVAGATQLKIVGDLITELAMRYAGDWIEARGAIVSVGNSSRRCEFEIHKIGAARPDISDSAAEFLDEPILTLKAVGTTVVPKEHQRFTH
jgi:3-aminobutyryl-CoA ammonia-lyase